MGGPCSGRFPRNSGKQEAEGVLRLCIAWMRDREYLRPGARFSLYWKQGARIEGLCAGRCAADHLELKVHWQQPNEEWRPVEQVIRLDHTACTFGGTRPWFVCACGRRCGVLYRGAGGRFRCRTCCGLVYGSQTESERDRLLDRSRKLRRRLLDRLPEAERNRPEYLRQGGRNCYRIPRPFRMHYKTWIGLLREIARLEQRWDALGAQELQGLCARYKIDMDSPHRPRKSR
jgi:hypothetical protein